MASLVAAQNLRNRYARLAGELSSLRVPAKYRSRLRRDRDLLEQSAGDRAERIAQLERDMLTLEAALRMLQPDWSPEDVAPIRPLRRRSPLPHGGIAQAALDLLRISEHRLTSREIGEALAERLHLDRSSVAARERLRDNIGSVLARLDTEVAHDGGRPRRWWAVGGPADD